MFDLVTHLLAVKIKYFIYEWSVVINKKCKLEYAPQNVTIKSKKIVLKTWVNFWLKTNTFIFTPHSLKHKNFFQNLPSKQTILIREGKDDNVLINLQPFPLPIHLQATTIININIRGKIDLSSVSNSCITA